MKSCLSLLLVLLVIAAVLGSGGLIWYLSANTEFSRKDATPSAAIHPPAVPPAVAKPVPPKPH